MYQPWNYCSKKNFFWRQYLGILNIKKCIVGEGIPCPLTAKDKITSILSLANICWCPNSSSGKWNFTWNHSFSPCTYESSLSYSNSLSWFSQSSSVGLVLSLYSAVTFSSGIITVLVDYLISSKVNVLELPLNFVGEFRTELMYMFFWKKHQVECLSSPWLAIEIISCVSANQTVWLSVRPSPDSLVNTLESVLEAAKLTYANKTKKSIHLHKPWNLLGICAVFKTHLKFLMRRGKN